LLDGQKKVLQGRRERVLNIGEKLDWKPDLARPDGEYYLVCQYKKMSSIEGKDFNQTWSQLTIIEAPELREVYVISKQLEFKISSEGKRQIRYILTMFKKWRYSKALVEIE